MDVHGIFYNLLIPFKNMVKNTNKDTYHMKLGWLIVSPQSLIVTQKQALYLKKNICDLLCLEINENI